jgi:hypothetical protein
MTNRAIATAHLKVRPFEAAGTPGQVAEKLESRSLLGLKASSG